MLGPFRSNRTRRVAALCAIAAFAGCDETPTMIAPDAPMSADPDSGPPASDAPEPSGERTIAAIVAGDPDFSILLAAARRAGLVDLLDRPGTYTVFAPNNAAFAASGLTEAMVTSLEVSALQTILTYHALGAEVPSRAVTEGVVTTAANLSLVIGTRDGVTLNGGNAVTGGANVIATDIEASNGVIHVIDRVLLPPDVADLTRYAGLTTLRTALESANLVDDLEGEGPFTVFAPTNSAFEALSSLPSGDALERVLLNHVVSGRVTSDMVPPRASSLARNPYGANLTLLFATSSGVRVNGRASVVVADVRATNGVVHVVDQVILPMNVVDAATAAGLTRLLDAVEVAAPIPGAPPTPLATALTSQAPYTVFAPTNAAFEAISTTTMTLTPEQLRDVLLFHVLDTTAFPMPVMSSMLPSMPSNLETLASGQITFRPDGPTFQGARLAPGWSDIVVTNGVIHVIDAVMLPSS